jgi:hypothetical protein
VALSQNLLSRRSAVGHQRVSEVRRPHGPGECVGLFGHAQRGGVGVGAAGTASVDTAFYKHATAISKKFRTDSDDKVSAVDAALAILRQLDNRRGRPMEFGIFDHVDANGSPLQNFYDDRLRIVKPTIAADLTAYHVAEHHSTPLGLALPDRLSRGVRNGPRL